MPSIGANRTGPRMGGSRMNGGSSRMRSVPAARSYASGPRPAGASTRPVGGARCRAWRARPGRSPRTASVGVTGEIVGEQHAADTDGQAPRGLSPHSARPQHRRPARWKPRPQKAAARRDVRPGDADVERRRAFKAAAVW